MRKVLKIAGFLAAAAMLFFIVVILAFYHLIQTGDFRRYLINEIQQQTDLRVQLGEADLAIGRILGVSFRDVTIAETAAPVPVISAERVTARVAFWPLLERRLVFYELRLIKPSARVARDKDGNLPLLDLLLNLPFLKQDNARFALDLRAVEISKGELEFTDESTDKNPVTLQLREVALVLERMRGQVLREAVRNLVRSKGNQPRGTALKFDLSAGIERDGHRAQWRAQGKLVFPGEKLSLAGAWCDCETRIGEMPATMAQVYGAKRSAVKFIGGKLDSRLRFQGYFEQRLHVSGTVGFTRLSVDAPKLFAAPLNAGDGQLKLDIEWQPGQWEISRMEYSSQDLSVGVKGRVQRVAGGDIRLRLDLSAKPLSVAMLKKYFPERWLASSQLDKFVGAIVDGEVQLRQAGINAKLGEIHVMSDSGFDKRIWFDADLRNINAIFSGGYLPITSINGKIVLENGRYTFTNMRGAYGRSRVAALDGSYINSASGPGVLSLRAQGEADLAELQEQAERGILPAEMFKAALAVRNLAGKGKFDVTLNRPVEGSLRAEGNLTLEDARLQWGKYQLTAINGDLALTPAEIKTGNIRALIFGSPVDLRLALKDYATEDGTFDLVVDSTGVKAGFASDLLLDRGSIQDPGVVGGSVHYRGSLNRKQERQLTGNLNLVNVQLETPPLLQPLRQLSGKVSIEEGGIEFQGLTGLLVGAAASASGRWRHAQNPQLTFDFAAPNLDISYLISQIDPEATEFYDTLQAQGRMALDKGRVQNFEFTGLKSDVMLDHRVWHFTNLTARAGGGTVDGPITIVDKPDTLGISTESRIQNVPVAAFLHWFDITPPEITGTLDLNAKVDTIGNANSERKRNMNGTFNLKITKGTIHRMRIIVQLLNVLDLSRWFTLQLPDLGKQGIRFRAITSDFKVHDGVYSTDNLVVDSDDLRMTGAGKIDVPKDELDFVVAVRPFAGIDTAINYIPLIGRGIAAIKNSFLVASFHIKGPIEDPTITPAPLSTVSEWFWGVLGIPKHIIGLGDEKKDEKEPGSDNASPPGPGR
jgi:uncharacterized protein involved in outer membrane biogenesis